MSLPSVGQAQLLCGETEERLALYPAASVMLLGAAGGNGLEHIIPEKQQRVFCVDINGEYLTACRERYAALIDTLETIQTDLSMPDLQLPHADLMIADLILEYIGCAAFQRVLWTVKPEIVSCITQLDNGEDFVSESPFTAALSKLDTFHQTVDEEELRHLLERADYGRILEKRLPLANGKILLRLDFKRNG